MQYRIVYFIWIELVRDIVLPDDGHALPSLCKRQHAKDNDEDVSRATRAPRTTVRNKVAEVVKELYRNYT